MAPCYSRRVGGVTTPERTRWSGQAASTFGMSTSTCDGGGSESNDSEPLWTSSLSRIPGEDVGAGGGRALSGTLLI